MTSYTIIGQAIQLLMYKLLLYNHYIAWWHKKEIVSAIDFFIKNLYVLISQSKQPLCPFINYVYICI